MANLDAAFGFRPTRHASGGTVRANEYDIASGLAENIKEGDVVKSNGSGGIQLAAAGDAVLGIFKGVSWTATDGEVRYSNQWTSGTATKGSLAAKATVYDDPKTIFMAQASGSVIAADIGLIANISVTAGDASTGISAHEVGAHDGSETQLKILKIMEVPGRSSTGHGNSGAGANAIVEAMFIKHEMAGAAAGVEV